MVMRSGDIARLANFVVRKLGIAYGYAEVQGYHLEDDGVLSIMHNTGIEAEQS